VTEVRISLIADPAESAEASDALRPAAVRERGRHLAEHHARVASMMEFLEGHGFHFRTAKNAVHGPSTEVEAGEAKRLLLAAGFLDREFQIVLEYTRGWGML
jgi:hypothetical protein